MTFENKFMNRMNIKIFAVGINENIDYPSQIQLKLKYNKIPYVKNIDFSRRIILYDCRVMCKISEWLVN